MDNHLFTQLKTLLFDMHIFTLLFTIEISVFVAMFEIVFNTFESTELVQIIIICLKNRKTKSVTF